MSKQAAFSVRFEGVFGLIFHEMVIESCLYLLVLSIFSIYVLAQ